MTVAGTRNFTATVTATDPGRRAAHRRRPLALLAMSPPHLADMVFGKGWPGLHERAQLMSETVVTDLDAVDPAVLEEVEVLISGWGSPLFNSELLAKAPKLRAVIHQGGVASYLLPPHSGRTIKLSNAGEANAVPVAEYTLGMILLANKDAFRANRLYRRQQAHIDREHYFQNTGNYRRTVGIVGASRIGRKVLALLTPFDLDILLYDPTITDSDAAALNARLVPLGELMSHSDVVSLHAPVLPSTIHMIGAEQLKLMNNGTTLINTSRGDLIDQAALIAELRNRRIHAILDVTTPDVLPPGHELYQLDNAFLTPHIAGSMGGELKRLGLHVLAELDRYRAGQEFAYPEHL